MGIVASRHLSAETEHQIQVETGFSPHRIDYLLGQYLTLERDAEGVVLRSELLKVPPVAVHPLADRLVDVYLHPSKDFRHFIHGLSRFRHSVPLEQKLASVLSMYDTDGDGLLSVEQCDELIRRMPSTSREQRVMRWKLKMLMTTETLDEELQFSSKDQSGLRKDDIEQQTSDDQTSQSSQSFYSRELEQSQRISQMEKQQDIQKLKREQGDSIHQLRSCQQEEQLVITKLQDQLQSRYSRELDEKEQQAYQERKQHTEQREEIGDQLRDLESEIKFQREESIEFLDLEPRVEQTVKELLEQSQQTQELLKGHDFKTLRMQQRQELRKQNEEQQQIRNLKEFRKEQKQDEQQPQDNKGRINCEDFAYITCGIDLDQGLSLRFN